MSKFPPRVWDCGYLGLTRSTEPQGCPKCVEYLSAIEHEAEVTRVNNKASEQLERAREEHASLIQALEQELKEARAKYEVLLTQHQRLLIKKGTE